VRKEMGGNPYERERERRRRKLFFITPKKFLI
jgi:hypothetical protein